jgi:hypothetical protein
MSNTKIIAEIIAVLITGALGAVGGALGAATTALIVAGGLYLLGIVTMGTAQAAFLIVVSGGALLGGAFWSLWVFVIGATV